MRRYVALFFLIALCFISCTEHQGQEKTTETTTDAKVKEVPNDGAWRPPPGMVGLALKVDDSANKTYKNKQLVWNGSFVFDEQTNTVSYASAWQPTDGPFPLLYDDGPIDQGGHEPPGSKKGDHIFGVVVYIKPDDKEELEIEYGVINEDNNWIWDGKNGLIVVKKEHVGQVLEAKSLTIPKFGHINIKITLDTKKLAPSFQFSDPSSPPPIFLKGTMTNWGHVQVQDRGTRGDEKAGDALVTYVQKHNLDYSNHMGLLQFKRHVQFVFQFTSIHGREYKDDDDKAITQGVKVYADCKNDGTWSEQKLIHEKDSRGAVLNTAFVVCDGLKEEPCHKELCGETRCADHPACKTTTCKNDASCKTGERCNLTTGKCEPKTGQCTKDDCDQPSCEKEALCKCSKNDDCGSKFICGPSGTCKLGVRCQSESDCPPEHVCNGKQQCEHKPCTKNDCQTDRCKSSVICNNSSTGPVIFFVEPAAGPVSGGTKVTIKGERLTKGLEVTFDGKKATNIQWISEKLVHCETPAATKEGYVDVKVTNPDSSSNTFPRGYKYDNSVTFTPQITNVIPSQGDIAGGTKVTIKGRNLQDVLHVFFGGVKATQVKVTSNAEITCLSPARASGKVEVKVESSKGASDTLQDGFEFVEQHPKVDWARMVSPPNMTSNVGIASPDVYCQVFDAAFKTASAGATKGLKAEIGWGDPGTKPETWSQFNWKGMKFHKDVGNNDEWKGSVTIGKKGNYDVACRFSVSGGKDWVYADSDKDGSNNGYDSKDAGKIEVKETPSLALSSFHPRWGLETLETTVVVKGFGFTANTKVFFGTNQATVKKVVSSQELHVATPKLTAQKVQVSLEEGSLKATAKEDFTFTGTKANIGWCKLQWPPTIPESSQNIPAPNAGSPSADIYGQVFVPNKTKGAGPGANIVAHVGYGPTGTDPSKDATWVWFPSTYNKESGNNDEWKGSVTVPTAGKFDYAYRFSEDGGLNFWYCDTQGNTPPGTYSPAKAGKITVK